MMKILKFKLFILLYIVIMSAGCYISTEASIANYLDYDVAIFNSQTKKYYLLDAEERISIPLTLGELRVFDKNCMPHRFFIEIPGDKAKWVWFAYNLLRRDYILCEKDSNIILIPIEDYHE